MSLPRYPEYKESNVAWIGRLPMHWETLSARRLFDECREAALPEDEQLSATQRYGVIPQRLFMEMEDQKVVLALAGTSNFKRVREDDFVISLRSFQGGIEHSRYEGCVSPAYTVLRPNRTIAPRYWSYLLKSASYVSALQTVTAGIRDGKNISYSQFGGLEVPVPPVDEQFAIARLLDRETAKIDALIAEQEKLLALLAEKRQATISHAVTRGLDPDAPMKDSGIPWLGQVPAHWEVVTLRRVAKAVETGGTPSSEPPGSDLDGGMPWFTPGDFTHGLELQAAEKMVSLQQVSEGDAKCFAGGTILIVGIGATLGKVGLINVPASANQQINAVSMRDSNDSRFFAYSLSVKSEAMKFLSNSSTIGIMNQSKTKDIPVAVAPHSEQLEAAEFLDKEMLRFDSIEYESAKAMELLKERRSALIAAAVTGQIDVRGVVGAQAA